ncbi:tRNA pseudouridine synthase A [Phymastichus coffea]|uniref:tRNA pseudouridine synthase A n=1 Tax=Phymastichus coffea TaxID=108790 RepID=UPI00273A7E65|nr:tRNA pseudouridine synthase A [Phymastichus coffea]
MSNTSTNIRRHLIRLSYIGTNYRGSQKHATFNIHDVDSIQGATEASMYHLKKLCLTKPSLVLAGRTDAGVHALCTTGHVDLDLKPSVNYVDRNIAVQMMNRHLIKSGHEIRIYSFHEVSPEFHARFSAKLRTYMYRFMISKNPGDHKIPLAEFGRTLHLHLPEFDIDKMFSGIELFRGTKDFKTFSSYSIRSKNHKEDEHKRCFVRTLDVTMETASALMPFDPLSMNFNYYHIIFKSTSFLYNQIRRIVGALISLAASRVTEKDIITMLQVPSHHNWNTRITPAFPHGLYLMNVDYDENLIKPLN